MYALAPKIEIELSSGVWTDVTRDVLEGVEVVFQRGRQTIGPNSLMSEPGTLTFALNNSETNSASLAAYYSPYHTAVRAGFALRAQVRVTLSCPTYPSGVVLWQGRITDILPTPGINGPRRTRVMATDWIGNLAETSVEGVSLQTSQRQDQLVQTIFTACSDPDYNVNYTLSLATGTSTFATAMDITKDAERTVSLLEESHRIVTSERGRLYLLRGSILKYASSATWANTPISFTFSDDMVALASPASSDDVVQRIDVNVYPTTIDTSDIVLYSLGTSSTLIQPGVAYTALFGPFRNPAVTSDLIGGTSFVAVAATTDYLMNAAADGSGANLTANFTVSASTTSRGVAWTITNTGATAGYVTLLQLRGRGIYRTKSTITRSIGTAYGSRTVTIDMPYQTDLVASEAVADYYAALFSRPGQPASVTVSFAASRSDALADAACVTDQGDRIAVTETQTGLSLREYILAGQQWRIRSGVVWVTWTLEAVNMTSWLTPAYSSGSYTANGTMTWTVASGDVTSYRYLRTGTMMRVAFTIETSTIGGSVNTELRIAAPEGVTSAGTTGTLCLIRNGGTWAEGIVQAISGTTYLTISTLSGGNWTAGTDNCSVIGEIVYETTD